MKFEAMAAKPTTACSFHIPIPEIESAVTAECYHLCRVYELDVAGGTLRVAEHVGNCARVMPAALACLPRGVRPQTLLVGEDQLNWSAPFVMQYAGDDDDPKDAN